MKKVLLLKGLDCANCAAKIERNVAKLKGVDSVSVNFMTEKMILDINDFAVDTILCEVEKIVKKVQPGILMKPIER